MANKGMRKFALYSVHLFFNCVQTIRVNETRLFVELNTVHYNMKPLDKRLVTGWTIQEPKTSDGEIFRTRQDRLWSPPASCTIRTVSFPAVKWPESGVDHPPASSFEVKERVELYLHSRSGSSRPVLA